MKYPNYDMQQRKKTDLKNFSEAEAKLYMESESYREFELKRELLRPRRRLFFNDMFRMHYFYSNGRKWLYYNSWLAPVACSLSFLAMFGTTIAFRSWRVFFAAALSFVSVLAVCAVYSRSKAKAAEAKNLVRRYDDVGGI